MDKQEIVYVNSKIRMLKVYKSISCFYVLYGFKYVLLR